MWEQDIVEKSGWCIQKIYNNYVIGSFKIMKDSNRTIYFHGLEVKKNYIAAHNYVTDNHYKVNAFQAYPPFYINEDFWLKINSIHMNLIKDLYSIIKSLPSVPFNLATELCYAALYKECSFYLGKMKDSQSVSSDEGFCFHMRKESDEFGYFPDTIYLPTTALQLVQFDDYKYDFCINRIKSTIILIRKEIEDIIKL